jgi:DNA-binding MarR family transcriptional regulator
VNRPTSQPDSELASVLASEIRLIVSGLKRRLREHGAAHDLTPSQVAVLLRLEKDSSATVSNLARAEGMRPQSMSSAVASLQAAGLVQGAPDPSDGRKTLISLTSKCLKLIRDGRNAKQDWLTTTISHRFSAPEQEKIRAAIALLSRLVEQ